MMKLTPAILMPVSMLGAAILATPARAQALDDRFWLEISAYRPNINTDIQVSSVNFSRIGTEINAETDLGLLERDSLPAVHAGWRPGGRWSIGADYYSLRRDATKALSREITFEDVTYPVSASVTNEFNTDIYRFTIGYAFVRNDNLEVGGAIGVHATHVELAIAGQGQVGSAALQLQRRSEEFFAPMPTVGLFASFRLAPRLTLGGRLDYMNLSVGDYDGRLVNTEASLTWRFHRNIGVGIMYRLVDYRVDVEKARYTGRFDYKFFGPALFLQLGF